MKNLSHKTCPGGFIKIGPDRSWIMVTDGGNRSVTVYSRGP